MTATSSTHAFDPASTALVLVDLQNDFLHPEGAYGRADQRAEAIAALPDRLAPLADAMRARGGWIVSTHFTLVPGKGGEPFIADHLRRLRPFLARGDFAPGGWGHALVDRLGPADIQVEKVAYSAFYQSRMEFALARAGIRTLVFAGIVTQGGVATTLRAAHVRDFHTVLLSDGTASFTRALHENAVADLSAISEVMTCAEAHAWISGADAAG